MPKVEPLPTYQTWVPLSKNYGAVKEDVEPVNIPYFSEELFLNDLPFINQMNEDFQESVDRKQAGDVPIDDQVFYDVVQKLHDMDIGKNGKNCIV